MAVDELSRRTLLRVSLVAAAGLAGCASEPDESPSEPSEPSPGSTGETTPGGTTGEREPPAVASLTVSDFVLYALAGSHPHVHRRDGTQYIVVRLDSSLSAGTLRDRLTLELDGGPLPPAEHRPVPWRHDTVDLAFAAPKDDTFESGRVLFDGTERRSLASATLDRLNSPPTFEVSEPSVSPTEVATGDRVDATVEFSVANVGDGRGEFGASLRGNFESGSNTLTASVDAGGDRRVTGVIPIVGEGDAATVRLDWGSGEWGTEIPVVDAPAGSAAPTRTPAPE